MSTTQKHTPAFAVTALGFVDETGALALALGNPNRKRNERLLLAAPELVEVLRRAQPIIESLAVGDERMPDGRGNEVAATVRDEIRALLEKTGGQS